MLANAMGCLPCLQSLPPKLRRKGTSARQEDGTLVIRLPGQKGKVTDMYLCLPPFAAKDDFCRQIAGQFIRLCKRIACKAKNSWDIKACLIREEQFLWDNAVLSLIYSGNQKYNALDFLGAARESSIFRYEGQPVLFGLIATWNWYLLKPCLQEQKWTILQFRERFDLRRRLRYDKASHMMVDGMRSFYVVNPKGFVCSWICPPGTALEAWAAKCELIPRAYAQLHDVLIGRDLGLVGNRHGEIYLFSKNLALKWNRSGWHRVSGSPISDALAPYVTPVIANRIVDTVLNASENRQGALIVISTDTDKLLSRASKGVSKQLKQDHLFHISDVDIETLCRFAAIDGAMIIENNGLVRNAGVILEVPDAFTATGEGARTAAAAFASITGIAIKVSHDGPISVYEDGKETRRAG